MDMTHITELKEARTFDAESEFPMQMGAGSVDPELIEPRHLEIDLEALIAFASAFASR